MRPARLARPTAVLVSLLVMAGVAAAPPAAAAPKPRLPITMTLQPSNPSSSGAAGFAWTTVGSATYTCALDGSAATSCTSSKSYSGLLDGTHTFVLKGRLNGSYRPGTKIVSWVVDSTPPGAPTVSPVPSPTSTTSAEISFTNSDPTAVAHTCSLDGAPAVACTSPWSVGPLSEATHTVVVRSKDAQGVLGGSTSVSWDVDLTAPASVVLVGPSGPTSDTTATFTFSAAGATSYTCSLDGAAAVACTSAYTLTSVADGSHSLLVAASDGAGNAALPATALWTVDTAAPPVPSILTEPADPTNQTTVDLVVSNPDGGSTLQCRLDSTLPGAWATCPSPLHWSGLAAGLHSLDIRSVDAAANASAVVTAAWTIDLTAPAPAQIVAGPLSPSNDPLPSFDFFATDSTATTVCSLDGALPFVACDIDTVPLGSGVGEGPHVLQVKSVDSASNESAPVAWTWTVDLTAPAAVVFSSAPDASTEATTAAFAFTSELSATHTCALDGAVATACSSPITVSGLAVGPHTFAVTVVDAANNTGPLATYAWTVTPPVVVTPTPTPTPTPSTPPVTGSPAAPATRVTLAPATGLLGRSSASFSADTHGVSATTVRLVSATGTAAAATLACTGASGAAADCATGPVRTVGVTPVRPLVPGQRYTLAVAGVLDGLGRQVSGSSAFRASTDEQETSAAAVYTWRRVAAAKAFGRSYLVENHRGAALTYSFTGTSVTWFTMTGPTQGRAKVYVDGVRKARVNNWSAATKWRVARTVTGLKAGSHKLKIVVAGRKGSTSGRGTFVAVDATKVGTARVKASPVLTAGWQRVTTTAASGSGFTQTNLAGAGVSMTFRGTSVSWVTATGPAMGKAKVYVDGVLKLTVDNYAKRAAFNVRRTIKGLTDGQHTIKVQVTGTKRRAATGTTVVVDRWLVG